MQQLRDLFIEGSRNHTGRHKFGIQLFKEIFYLSIFSLIILLFVIFILPLNTNQMPIVVVFFLFVIVIILFFIYFIIRLYYNKREIDSDGEVREVLPDPIPTRFIPVQRVPQVANRRSSGRQVSQVANRRSGGRQVPQIATRRSGGRQVTQSMSGQLTRVGRYHEPTEIFYEDIDMEEYDSDLEEYDSDLEIYDATEKFSPIPSFRNRQPQIQIEDIINEKRRKFINIPSISFHFANHEQIKNYYNEYFHEPVIDSIQSEISGENDGQVQGTIPQILQAGMSKKDTNRLVSNFKPVDISSNGMFLRYQKETIKRKQVLIGLEEVDIELTELQAFDTEIEKLENRFDLQIEERILNSQRTILKEKAAERTLVKLEKATGWVLIEGKFKIVLAGDFYQCIYIHPVNVYLSDKAGPVTISVLVQISALEEHIKGNYAQSIGKLVPLKVYGQVWQPLDRQTNIWNLQLTPLAIY